MINQLNRFVLHQGSLRGAAVVATSEWQALLTQQSLPQAACQILGEFIAASLLLSSAIKNEGSVALQVQGKGALKLLFAESDHERSFRGMAHVDEQLDKDQSLHTFADWVGGQTGHALMVLDQNGNLKSRHQDQKPYDERKVYQSVVALSDGDQVFETVSQVIAYTMSQSGQIPTHLLLAANQERFVGLLLQQMPAGQEIQYTPDVIADQWQTAVTLMETMKAPEMLTLDPETLIRRLFWEQDAQLLASEPVQFFCPCHETRVQRMIVGLGYEQVQSILAEQGKIEVRCEQCGKQYSFTDSCVQSWFTKPDGHTLH